MWDSRSGLPKSLLHSLVHIVHLESVQASAKSLLVTFFSNTQTLVSSWPCLVCRLLRAPWFHRVVGLHLAHDNVLPLHPCSRPARHWCRLMGLTDWCGSWSISGQGSRADWLEQIDHSWRQGCNFVSVVRGGCLTTKEKLLLLMKFSPEWRCSSLLSSD